MSAIANRLKKNHARLKSWAKQNRIEAYRIYDRDIPDYPFIVDLYGDYIVVYDRGSEHIDQTPEKKQHRAELREALLEMCGGDAKKVILKERRKQRGVEQYQKKTGEARTIVVAEGDLRFEVNLDAYLDTGLFLDHRRLRAQIQSEISGKSFLNLFSYTGAFTVAAGKGGAKKSLSVDLSKTYTEWARRNLKLNDLLDAKHEFLTGDLLSLLDSHEIPGGWDTIFLDPPTFSNSKKMPTAFEVEVEQEYLIDRCVERLGSGGVLYFSNNKRRFKLNPVITERYEVRNITEKTIPKDFRDPKVHHVFEIRKR